MWKVPHRSIALVKTLFSIQKYWYFSYFSTKTCCGYSLEAPHRGASNEYPQHTFSWRNKKNIYRIPSLIWTYAEALLSTNNIYFQREIFILTLLLSGGTQRPDFGIALAFSFYSVRWGFWCLCSCLFVYSSVDTNNKFLCLHMRVCSNLIIACHPTTHQAYAL